MFGGAGEDRSEVTDSVEEFDPDRNSYVQVGKHAISQTLLDSPPQKKYI